jgi:Cd2+/Zn2+-exporting ATPase
LQIKSKVKPMSDDTLQTRFRVAGMDCAACGQKIDTAVRRFEGVTDSSVSVTSGVLTLTHRPTANLDDIQQTIRKLGYTPTQETKSKSRAPAVKAPEPWWKSRRALLTAASGTALVVAYGIGKIIPAVEQSAFIAALAVGLVPIARRALSAAMQGTPFSIEMLMTIAAIGATIIGATEEAASIVFLFLVGEMLEGVAANRARESIQGLTALVPKTALLLDRGQISEVEAETLQPGQLILVRPGDRIPADGVIAEGESEINEAPVTGESIPNRKKAGETVFAGTVNGDGSLHIKVSAAASDNTIARLVRLVEEAQESKAPTERFITRFSKYYTPGVVAFAVLVATLPPLLLGWEWNEWVYKGLAVLLIGCPCALVISTPAAVASALSAGARRGLLIKGGAVLEQLGTLTTIAFDKTGTLTRGKPVVTDVVAAAVDARKILSLAAALEAGSSHPLALAILDRARTDKAPLPPAGEGRAVAGKGVEGRVGGQSVFLGSPKAAAGYAQLSEEQYERIAVLNAEGKTVSALVADGNVAGFIALRDEPRPDAEAGLRLLKDAGIKTLMLTGDNKRTAEAVGKVLGIDVNGEMLPQDKMCFVKELKSRGERVGKVGDGINDAPALAAADVGIAMGGGTDVALETADAAVLHGRVSDVAGMVNLSRRTMRNIRQNITIALGLKAVFFATTVAGITGLWPAILADTGATVLVTANAMRLLRLASNQSSPQAHD